jgi:nicotinamidase-related amidase
MKDLSRTVLLPIDVQRGFDDPSWPPRWNGGMEANGRALLAYWRAAGAPIIHVRHDSVQEDRLGPVGEVLGREFVAETRCVAYL